MHFLPAKTDHGGLEGVCEDDAVVCLAEYVRGLENVLARGHLAVVVARIRIGARVGEVRGLDGGCGWLGGGASAAASGAGF